MNHTPKIGRIPKSHVSAMESRREYSKSCDVEAWYTFAMPEGLTCKEGFHRYPCCCWLAGNEANASKAPSSRLTSSAPGALQKKPAAAKRAPTSLSIGSEFEFES